MNSYPDDGPDDGPSLRHRPTRSNKAAPNAKTKSGATKRVFGACGELLHLALWIAASVFVVVFSDLWRVLREDSRIDRLSLGLALVSLIYCSGCVLYLAVYIRVHAPPNAEDYEKLCPKTVRSGALAGVVLFLAAVKALWPVWGWVSLVMVAVLLMTALFIPAALPVP